MNVRISVVLVGTLLVLGLASPAQAATCADYANQAAAQKAADTRDGDGDGIYCESLPCPCAGKSTGSGGGSGGTKQPSSKCVLRRKAIISIGISATKYPKILLHIKRAVRAGFPAVTKIHRKGADERRRRAVAKLRPRTGYDRDEWPMAMARTRVRADVAYVPSSQNRGAGSVIGTKLRRYCDGQRFRVIGY